MSEAPTGNNGTASAGAHSARDVPTRYKRTEAGVIPADWRTSTIASVADIYSGATPSTQNPAYWNGSVPWCIPTDITGNATKYLTETARSVTRKGLQNCGATLLPVGSLLLCSRATIGELKIALSPICTNQGFKSLVCKENAYNEFLYYLLLTLKPILREKAAGSTFLEIGKGDLASIQIALPSLTEQRAIAEALSDVDGLLESLDALIAKKRAIKQAAMQKLLTGKTRLPGFTRRWEMKRLGEVVSIRNEKILPCRVASDTICLELEHISSGDGRLFQTIKSQDVVSSKYRFYPRDVLFGRLRPYLRKYWLADCHGICTTEIWPLISAPGLMEPGFLLGIIQSDYFIDAANVSYGTHMPRADWTVMREFDVQLPPIDEQASITAVLSDMDEEIATLEARLEKTRAIKQGMMQQLLTGRVRLI